LPILRWPDERLSTLCEPAVRGDATAELAADMLETMYDAPGRGLAAPQVGVLTRLFVMDATWKEGRPDPHVFLNPVIIEKSPNIVTGPEGCLSIPGIEVPVARADWVVVRWKTPEGLQQEARLEGFAAICVQHETDHLDGRVTLTRVDPAARKALEAQYIGQQQ